MSERQSPRPEGSANLASLESTLKRFAVRGPAPVELWEPEYCGEIGLRIGAEGTWYYRDSPIGRKALVRLFSTILRKDPDGRHYLVTPVEKIAIDVADAPFRAVEMKIEGKGREQRLSFRTDVGDEVTVSGDHPIRFEIEPRTHGIKPYVLVRGALEALVTRALTYDLVELAEGNAGGKYDQLGVWSCGIFYPLGNVEGTTDSS